MSKARTTIEEGSMGHYVLRLQAGGKEICFSVGGKTKPQTLAFWREVETLLAQACEFGMREGKNAAR